MSPTLMVFLFFPLFAAAAHSNHSLVAEEGDDVLLPCVLDPQVDASGSTVEWSKDGRENIVHLYINRRDRAADQGQEFRNRTALFHQGLSGGNASLQLTSVTPSDRGTYRCFVVRLKSYCYVVLGVVTKAQFTSSTTARPSLDEEPGPDNPSGNTNVCVDVLTTVGGVFLIVLLVVIGMILGIIWVYRRIRGRGGRGAEGPVRDSEMENLRVDGGEGGNVQPQSSSQT